MAGNTAPRAAEVTHLQGKLLLKPDRFTSLRDLHKFGKRIKAHTKSLHVGFEPDDEADEAPRVREVIFGDTPDFRLYQQGFILRRRIPFVDGFPDADPEIVFKFRSPDRDRASGLDVRPAIRGKFQVKFKAQILPLKDRLGGYRLLYSHNCQFGLSQAPEGDRRAVSFVTRAFPALKAVKQSRHDRIELVNEGIVEELLLPIGKLDFGKKITAKSSIALWRTRGDHTPLVGEYSFQLKFAPGEDLPRKAERRVEEYFVALQREFKDWIAVGATKTALVYGLNGHRVQRG